MKKPPRWLPVLLVAATLPGCETRHPARTPAAEPARPRVEPPALRPAPRPAPDTADLTRYWRWHPGPADSLIQLGTRRYRLSVRVETDSTRPIYAPAESAGPAFAAPGDTASLVSRVRGYEETYTFTLRDSLGRGVIFRRQLHKPDFYKVTSPDIAVVMNQPPPAYLGYSAGLGALVFVCYLGIPYSDVGGWATLLLDRQGRVLRLSYSGALAWDARDCNPRISPSGRAVLTCSELLRAGQPPLPLEKPQAELLAARFLNDTTLLLLYRHGHYVTVDRAVPEDDDPLVTAPMSAETEWVSTPAQRRLPTAYIMSTSGRVRRTFRLTATGAAGNEIGRAWLRPAVTYLLLEESKKLVLIPKAHPDSLVELPLKQIPRFRPPQRPHEQPYDIQTDFTRLRVYVDTLRPRKLRYQVLKRVD